jgi:predicted MPP superfamily phosphohydrolase
MSTSTANVGERTEAALDRRKARMSRFMRVLLGATILVHVPVVLAVAEFAARLGASRPALWGLAWGCLGVGLFVGRARAGMPDRPRSPATVRFFDVPYFVHWCAAVYSFFPSIAVTVVAPFVELARGVPVRAPMAAYLWIYGSGLVVCGYGVLIRRRWVRVVEREMKVPGLDPRFDGFRIAHLSDLHIGALTPRSWGLAWARLSNGTSPDLAVVTGDMVTSGTGFHEDIADVVAALRAKHGVYASMGNHDYFGEPEPLVGLLRARGVNVLRNEGVVIERDGARLWLAAIDDTWTRRDDLALALAGRPMGATAVLLAHDPAHFERAADAGANVVLSGHTHGGQVALPFLADAVNLAVVYPRYRVRFYRRGRSVLYVHPGLGTTGPPMRLGVAPEITVLVLRPE